MLNINMWFFAIVVGGKSQQASKAMDKAMALLEKKAGVTRAAGSSSRARKKILCNEHDEIL